MANRENELLFDLIKSLSKGEKRSFKQFAKYTSVKDKKYLALLDIIDDSENYNEKVIKDLLEKKKILTPLPVLKNYLQEHILDFLRFYNSGLTVQSKIINHLLDAEIFYHKGLEKFKDKSIQKAKALSKKHDKFEAYLMSLNDEWNYKSIFNPKEVSEEYKIILEEFNRSLKYRQLLYDTSKLLEKGEIRDDELKNSWDKIIQDPLMNIETEPSGYEDNYYYHHNWMRYFHRTRDYEKCCLHQEKLIKHFESRPELLLQYKIEYMFELNGLVVAYSQLHQLSNAKDTITKLIKMQSWELSNFEKLNLIDITLIALSNVMHGFFKSDFSEILDIAKQAEALYQSNQASTFHKAFLFLNLAKINIYIGNYEQALYWNNLILNEKSENKRDDFNVLAWIFNLIIHFELGNKELIPSLIKSTYNFLEKRNRLYKVENIILEFLKDKALKATTRKELIELFKKLKTDFEAVVQDPYEAKAFEYFDFILWLQSKIENKTVAELIKKSPQ